MYLYFAKYKHKYCTQIPNTNTKVAVQYQQRAPPTKVDWTKSMLCKICIEWPTKSLRIFLSKFQWTPRKRVHQSITQSRLR